MAIAEVEKSKRLDQTTHDLLTARAPVHSPIRSVATGALAMLSLQPLTWAASMLAVIFVPRYLGDVALGQFTLGQTLSALAGPVVSLGLLEYLSRSLASQSQSARREATQAWILMTVAATLVGALLALGAWATALPVGSPFVLLYAVGMIVITPTQGLLLTVLRGQERMGRFAMVSSLSAAAATILPIGVLVLGGGLNGVALSTLLVNVIAVGVAWKTSGVRLPRVALNLRELWALVPAGLPFFGWNLTMQFYGQIDRIMIGLLAPVQVVGWYAAAVRIIAVPIFIPMLIITPLFPALTRCRGDRVVFRHTLNATLRATVLATAPFCAATAAAAPAIPRFLGWPAEFDAATAPMMILAPNLTLVAMDMVLGTALLALGLERKWLMVGIVAAVINPSLNLLGIPFAQAAWGNGGIASATVTVVTELVMLAGALLLLPRGLIDRRLGFTIAGTVGAGATFVFVTRQLLAFDVVLPLAVTAGAGAFVLAMLVLRAVSLSEVAQTRAFALGIIGSRIGRQG